MEVGILPNTGKDEIVSGNYNVLYSGEVDAE